MYDIHALLIQNYPSCVSSETVKSKSMDGFRTKMSVNGDITFFLLMASIYDSMTWK